MLVPEAGVEPALPKETVFETVASAIPPLGHVNEIISYFIQNFS